MLDTIILSLPRSDYRITRPERFNPHSTLLDQGGFFLVKCVNNPTKEEKESGFYYPRLTLIKRPLRFSYEIWLKIEFSAPKILFNNNLDELKETDLDDVVACIQERLLHMGVMIETDKIRRAKVTAFHASKNIALTGGYTAGYVIKELNKINLTRKMDFNKSDFRNDGQSMQCYATSHSFVVYDKLRDLGKTQNRAIDKDRTSIQMDLFADIKTSDPRLEIIRFEARLSKKPKMNSTLSELGYSENPTMTDIFNEKLSKAIIEKYWRDITNRNLFLFEESNNQQTTLREIFRHDPKMKPKQAIYLIGLSTLCKNKDGVRALRAICENTADPRTWTRVSKGFLILNSISNYANQTEWLAQINEGLEKFIPYRTK